MRKEQGLKLKKENAELKAQIEQLSNDNHVLKTSFIMQQEQIEKMKNCLNCDKEYTNSPDCKDCKYSRKYDGKQDKWEKVV